MKRKSKVLVNIVLNDLTSKSDFTVIANADKKMFDFAKRHVRLHKVRCSVVYVRTKSANNYGIARITSLAKAWLSRECSKGSGDENENKP